MSPVQTPTLIPERSREQRMIALAKANYHRGYRANLKRELQAGRMTFDQVLRNPTEEVMAMKVVDVMLHMPKYGRVKVNKILGKCQVSPSKTIGGLTDRQRYELITLVRR